MEGCIMEDCIMEGRIKEGAEALSGDGDENVLDLGIIGAGSRVEHYEIAGYLTAISLAEQIGEKQVVALLKQSLAEEEGAENKLRKIASGLLKSAPTKENGRSSLIPSVRAFGEGEPSLARGGFLLNKILYDAGSSVKFSRPSISASTALEQAGWV
jgi:hypothetical protein